MTEPVAYRKKDVSETLGWRYSTLKPVTKNYEPLYTAEQLHKRVKMTQAEFDEFDNLYRMHMSLVGALGAAFGNKNYNKLKNRFMNFDTTQAELANLIVDFVPDYPETTIEIVEEKKWFVRSKEQYQPDMDQGISESGYIYLSQGNIYSIEYYDITTFKDEAQQFETKEEAELWTNPLTEAVQLPVDGE